jgi:hypothetical protein
MGTHPLPLFSNPELHTIGMLYKMQFPSPSVLYPLGHDIVDGGLLGLIGEHSSYVF